MSARAFSRLPGLLLGLSVLLGAGTVPVRAATELDPPFITIPVAESVGVLTVTNDRSVAAGYDIEALGWEQDADGAVTLPPTDGIRVEPTSLDLPPGGSAEVRVVALAPPPAAGEPEQVYRVRVSERPDREREEGEEVLQVIASFTLPVFRTPPDAAPAARLVDTRLADGELTFAVANDGTGHTYVIEVRVTGRDADGLEVFDIRRQGWYVLPGGRLRFRATVSAEDCRRSRSVAVEARPLAGDAVWRGAVTPDDASCGDREHTEFPRPGVLRSLPGQPPGDGVAAPEGAPSSD